MEKILKRRVPEIVAGQLEKPLIAAVKELDKVSKKLRVHGYEIGGLSVTLKGTGPIPEFKVDLVRTKQEKEV